MANQNSKSSKTRRGRKKYNPQDKMSDKIKTTDVDIVGKHISDHNDPEWYIFDKTMYDGVIQMPTLEFKGKNIPWRDDGHGLSSDEFIRPPSVAAYYMNPSAGFTGRSNDLNSRIVAWNNPINVAARKMYAELSASNAKTSSYAPQDIATLILSVGQVIAIINHLRRVYGVANYFNFYNRSVPEAILKLMGFDYSTVRSTLSDIRAQINQRIARINSIKFPGTLSYFKKCEYIYSNIFVDRDDEMPTYHFMTPYSSWRLDEESSPEGSVLKTNFFSGTSTRPFSNYITLVDTMIDAILTSSTFNFIFADVINLYNRNVLTDETINIDMLPIDYVIEPVYSEQFNWQVMNMTIGKDPNYSGTLPGITQNNDVYQSVDDNAIVYKPRWVGQTTTQYTTRYNWKVPVRLPNTQISHDELVELLAYYNQYEITSDGDTTWAILPSPSDYYCVTARMLCGSDLTTPVDLDSNFPTISNAYRWNQIVHAPFIAMYNSTATEGNRLHALSKLGSFTQIDHNALDNLRFQTFLGLFKFT